MLIQVRSRHSSSRTFDTLKKQIQKEVVVFVWKEKEKNEKPVDVRRDGWVDQEVEQGDLSGGHGNEKNDRLSI